MSTIDLTNYVIAKWGEWHKNPDNFSPVALKLLRADDGLTLTGPARVRVTVQAQNDFTVHGTSLLTRQAKDIFSYILDIPPGQLWTYPAPELLSERIPELAATGLVNALAIAPPPPAPPPAETPVAVVANLWRRLRLGSNDGFAVIIRVAGPDICADPCAPDPCATLDPCAPKKPCHCGCSPCTCASPPDSLPCDFAVASHPNLGTFFPAACEPCTPGASIGMPTLRGPTLIVPPARGGTMRTRFFNGMYITREDLETEQRNVRLKRSLMNRALGQGVVWGFNVCRDGEAICVLPGYGVDCCGSDIIISSPYRVDAQALLRDPAAAAILSTPGAHRMHLLLEYYECPEQPRPVHGDPCAPDTTRCETSRIRETARLRLVPPCDVDDSGPIKGFLDEVTKSSQNTSILHTLRPEVIQQLTPSAKVPFSVEVQSTSDPNPPVTLIPPISPPPAEDDVAVQALPSALLPSGTVRITLRAQPNFHFVKFQVVQTRVFDTATRTSKIVPALPVTPSIPNDTEITWEADIPQAVFPLSNPSKAQPIPPAFAYQLQGWSLVEDASGNQFSATSSEIDLTVLERSVWAATPWGSSHSSSKVTQFPLILHVEVQPTQVQVSVPSRQEPFPCLFEDCDPNGMPRFPTTIPWLHPGDGGAADPKVIMLAILYAWLAAEMARNKIGTGQATSSAQLHLATQLYGTTQGLFSATTLEAQNQLTDALQRLFQAWCCSFLYPGPQCRCEPHGVVIGCVQVSSGEIGDPDPWGGRRWVVHYPLLSYWGQQLGIMPLDAIASRLFGFICCIAGLAAPGRLTGEVERPVVQNPTVPLGTSMLLLAQPAAVPAQLQKLGIVPVRTELLNPVDFVARAATAVNAGTAGAATGQFVQFTAIGVPELHLIAPDVSAPAPVPVPPQPAEPVGGGRLRELVRNAIATLPARTAVPPLLRDFSEELARNVLAATPVQPTRTVDAAVVARLADAGVNTVGNVLGRSPDDLHTNVLNRENAPALAALLTSTEKDVGSVAKVVGDVVRNSADEQRIVSRDDLTDTARATEFSARLADALRGAKLAVPSVALAQLVQDTAKAGG